MEPMRIRPYLLICAVLAAALARAERMPERIVFSTEHGLVTRAGSQFRFEFKGASLPEMMTAASRVFLVLVACPEGGSGRFDGTVLAHTAAEGLAGIAGIAGCRVRAEGAAWLVGLTVETKMPEVHAAGLGLKGGCAAAKGSP